jgi:uncharacterized membrane protein
MTSAKLKEVIVCALPLVMVAFCGWSRKRNDVRRLKHSIQRDEFNSNRLDNALTSDGNSNKRGNANMRRIGAEGHVMAIPVLERRLRTLFMVLCGAALGLTFGASKAFADFRVCNATQSLVGVALGFRTKTGWVTEGWWAINPSNCKTLIEGPLLSRYYYVFAEDAERGGRWEGGINMCVGEKQFEITGINDCFARGFQRVGFQEYDTGEQSSWMVQLTDEANTEAPTAPAKTGDETLTITPEVAPNATPTPTPTPSTNP